MTETFAGKTLAELKEQRITLLSRVLACLEREVAAAEKAKSKKVPRDLCEKLRLVGNELRVEQRPPKQKETNQGLDDVDRARKQVKTLRVRFRRPG